MSFNYSLSVDDYSWKNAILWGNFSAHCQKVTEGTLCDRIVHVLIAALEFLPIIGQIASIFEKIIVTSFSNPVEQKANPNLSNVIATSNQNVTSNVTSNVTTLPGTNTTEEQKEMDLKVYEEQSPSVIKIQSYCRMSLTQRMAEEEKRNLLSTDLFEKAKPYMDDLNELKKLHKTCGRTSVYLHDDFVIKNSGHPNNQERFNKMRQARKIVDKNKYSCLEIPTACTYGNFLVENRLPIMNVGIDRKVQIGFYLDHIEQFNTAVEEFTGFLCQSTLGDIVGGLNDGYESLCEEQNVGRYENVAMYMEEKDGVMHGKIGLIDLEDFKPQLTRSIYSTCKDAVCLFPHHLEIIINEAKKFDSNVESWRKELESLRDKQLQYFKVAYQDHLDFVKMKNLDLTDPFKSIEISIDREEQIKGIIEQIMREDNQHEFQDFLGEKVEDTVKKFKETAFPEILKKLLKFLNKPLKETCYQDGYTIRYRQKDASEITSYSKLISTRTLEYGRSDFTYKSLKSSMEKDLGMLAFQNIYRKDEFVDKVIDTFFRELVKGKEIAYYNPNFGIGSYAYINFCIFC